MAKINNVTKYPNISIITGNEILLGSVSSITGNTINIPVNILSEFIQSNLLYNDDFTI